MAKTPWGDIVSRGSRKPSPGKTSTPKPLPYNPNSPAKPAMPLPAKKGARLNAMKKRLM